jgi:hypothetical protein
MAELPHNWNEIRADKGFWDLVRAFQEADSRWSIEELSDEDEAQLHELALDFVTSEGDTVFGLDFVNHHGRPASATVQQVAGKFYVADWSDSPLLCGPHATVEAGAMEIISGGNGDTFTGASSSLPAGQMHALCAEAAGNNHVFKINGVMHIRTAEGFVPA